MRFCHLFVCRFVSLTDCSDTVYIVHVQYNSIFRPLQFGEIVAVTGLPKSQLQNWTSGRPLWVLPSFSQGRGKGKHDLFALEDAYLLCYLQSLRQKGLSTDVLERVVQDFNDWLPEGKPVFRYFRPQVSWLVLNLSPTFRLLDDVVGSPKENKPRILAPQQVHDFSDDSGLQIAVNLLRLRHRVNHRAHKFLPDFPAVEDSFCECFFPK